MGMLPSFLFAHSLLQSFLFSLHDYKNIIATSPNMALILSIDTSINIASVSLAIDGVLIAKEINTDTKSHGSFIQIAITKLFIEAQKKLQDVDAIAVVNGPGSYTGLRVGLATAKGLCFTLNKPLILLNTLEVLAQATISRLKTSGVGADLSNYLICPMIDARRMEVFMAIYDTDLNERKAPCALILNDQSFDNWLTSQKIVFTGNGHQKLKEILTHPNVLFDDEQDVLSSISVMAEKLIRKNKQVNLAYSEPFYIKDVYFAEKTKV